MALMFPRLARNFAKNGYYPTDEATLERTLALLELSNNGHMHIIDPCAGEGVALAEAAHHLGRDHVQAYAVEYNTERAMHAKSLVDHCLRSDLMDTMISRQSFGLLWLNPPYGDLPADFNGLSTYQGTGRKRLEKLFYQRSLPYLQYDGILVFIVPYTVLDAELCTWLSNHFTALAVFEAVDKQFKQVVIFGKRTRSKDRGSSADQKAIKEQLIAVGQGSVQPPELPIDHPLVAYHVPKAIQPSVEHFYRISIEPQQLLDEIQRVQGLWSSFNLHFGSHSGALPQRQPVRPLSDWHLALSLAAGAISGVLQSQSGRTLVVKGNTHKEKSRKVEFTQDDDGNVSETRIDIDRFVPVIKAWDLTEGSPTFACVLTISGSNNQEQPDAEEPEDDQTSTHQPLFEMGRVVVTQGINQLNEQGVLNIHALLHRHAVGDWGDICKDDWESNQDALTDGYRLFSSYEVDLDETSKIWIITEADRSVTTVLLPSEY